MLSDKGIGEKKAIVVSVPGIHATYSVTDSLQPKLIHSWIQARQKNHNKVKGGSPVMSPQPHKTSVAGAPKSRDKVIDKRESLLQRKLPPIVSLYTPATPTSVKPRKTLYSNYMDNIQSPVQEKRPKLKWDGYYERKTQSQSAEYPQNYDFINFVGSPILPRDKYLQCLQVEKRNSRPITVTEESSTVSSNQSQRPQQTEGNGFITKGIEYSNSESETGSQIQALDSMTLPCIEEILRSEGIEELDIAQQMRIIKDDELKTFIKTHNLPDTSAQSKSLPRLTKISVNILTERQDDRQMEKPNRQELNQVLHGQIREWLQSYKHKQNQSMLRRARVPEMPIVISKSTEKPNIPVTNIHVPNHFCPRVVLVANNIPKSDLLVNTVLHRRNDLITLHYSFDTHSLPSLLRDIQKRLQTYHEKWNTTVMKSLLIVCNGGPGYFHLVKGKPITTQVLKKDESIDVTVFFKGLSSLFSSSGCYFHVMGCDAFTGKLGKQFLSLLEKKMSHSSVKVEQLENRPGHQQTLRLYMDPKQYRRWTERVAKLHRQL